VAQLYLHMLCLESCLGEGEVCTSALFMSASATRGAHLFRLRRDEALMRAVVTHVARFAHMYGHGQPPPPEDYFWGSPGYEELLEQMVRASKEHVELVARIPNSHVQRGRDAPFFL
jgi:hypothetical protein